MTTNALVQVGAHRGAHQLQETMPPAVRRSFPTMHLVDPGARKARNLARLMTAQHPETTIIPHHRPIEHILETFPASDSHYAFTADAMPSLDRVCQRPGWQEGGTSFQIQGQGAGIHGPRIGLVGLLPNDAPEQAESITDLLHFMGIRSPTTTSLTMARDPLTNQWFTPVRSRISQEHGIYLDERDRDTRDMSAHPLQMTFGAHFAPLVPVPAAGTTGFRHQRDQALGALDGFFAPHLAENSQHGRTAVVALYGPELDGLRLVTISISPRGKRQVSGIRDFHMPLPAPPRPVIASGSRQNSSQHQTTPGAGERGALGSAAFTD